MACRETRRIDLHVHSTASDGTLTPLEIVKKSEQAGLAALSITDHDTVAGCRPVLEAALPASLKFLTGVEISAAYPASCSLSGSLHVLGYDIDIHDTALNHGLERLQTARNQRTPKILEQLNRLGMDISMAETAAFAGGGQVGRAHIAQAMKARGVVRSIREAFDRYLGKNKPAYVDKERIPCDRAIALIRQAGGVAVLAHPFLVDTPDDKALESLVSTLVDMGMQGIEALYPQHTKKQTAFYKDLARRYNLLITGGTDFHGDLNSEVALGKATGNFYVDYELYEKLIAVTRHQL
ncbi:PHP domain-containing protein [Desulfosudis oleivorans]|uniref:PHP domain protein n=1 Tax=Desulfosudis oleivorans (strain DSM 6200 / JCM 39069 / Hxd3) TaxID=96561 RepID=A8ZZF4_DESOH|nr:PHP domain-containing protein [Desulfosudis oleivorans]ABW67307.1 PHP domain protein [Desulfosudis oleivorans Hxd3]